MPKTRRVAMRLGKPTKKAIEAEADSLLAAIIEAQREVNNLHARVRRLPKKGQQRVADGLVKYIELRMSDALAEQGFLPVRETKKKEAKKG